MLGNCVKFPSHLNKFIILSTHLANVLLVSEKCDIPSADPAIAEICYLFHSIMKFCSNLEFNVTKMRIF